MVSRQDIGIWGERYVANRLVESGWSISGGPADLQASKDITLDIEVKTARQGKDGKWRARLQKAGHQNHLLSDVVVLVCISHTLTFFVIPTAKIASKRQLCITSNSTSYAGQYAAYRSNKLVL